MEPIPEKGPQKEQIKAPLKPVQFSQGYFLVVRLQESILLWYAHTTTNGRQIFRRVNRYPEKTEIY